MSKTAKKSVKLAELQKRNVEMCNDERKAELRSMWILCSIKRDIVEVSSQFWVRINPNRLSLNQISLFGLVDVWTEQKPSICDEALNQMSPI